MRMFGWLVLVCLVGFHAPLMAQETSLADDFKKIRRDPPPESLTQGHSYLTSDEAELYLFKDAVTERGGLYVGLGTDPNYVFAAWSKADVAVLVDFDQNVVDLHAVYGAFFKQAKTPQEFIALWEKTAEESAHAAIDAFDAKRAKRLKRIYKAGRKKVLARLEWMRDTWPGFGASTFANDAAQYTYVAKMWNEGRVHAVRGDLTKDKTMSDIAKFAKRRGLNLTTLYLTNAEYYFPFETEQYPSNIMGLPMPEDSVVLHTFPRSQKEYRYVYQTGPVYQAWIKSKKVEDLRALIRRAAKKVGDQDHLYRITKLPNGKDTAQAPANAPKAAEKAAE
ncbi:MAG: hypothetical protein R3E66_22445 [bacterium]